METNKIQSDFVDDDKFDELLQIFQAIQNAKTHKKNRRQQEMDHKQPQSKVNHEQKEETKQKQDNPIRIAAYGKSGAGKSTLLNVLAGFDIFKVGESLSSETYSTQKEILNLDSGLSVELIDTPGTDDNRPNYPLQCTSELLTSINEGIHIALVLIPVESCRFEKSYLKALRILYNLLGPGSLDHIFIVFTKCEHNAKLHQLYRLEANSYIQQHLNFKLPESHFLDFYQDKEFNIINKLISKSKTMNLIKPQCSNKLNKLKELFPEFTNEQLMILCGDDQGMREEMKQRQQDTKQEKDKLTEETLRDKQQLQGYQHIKTQFEKSIDFSFEILELIEFELEEDISTDYNLKRLEQVLHTLQKMNNNGLLTHPEQKLLQLKVEMTFDKYKIRERLYDIDHLVEQSSPEQISRFQEIMLNTVAGATVGISISRFLPPHFRPFSVLGGAGLGFIATFLDYSD